MTLKDKQAPYSKQFPEVSGWYWMKGYGQYRTMPVEINGDLIFTSPVGQLHRRDLGESVEFAGPITVFDAERLIELRKAHDSVIRDLKQAAFAYHVEANHKPEAFAVCPNAICANACRLFNHHVASLNLSHLQEEKGAREK